LHKTVNERRHFYHKKKHFPDEYKTENQKDLPQKLLLKIFSFVENLYY